MTNDLHNLSLEELTNVIESAKKALAEKQKNERKAVIAKIKELADSIGLTVTIHEGDKPVSSRKGTKVAAKYRNPNNSSETWTGRGVRPRWLQALINAGRELKEFHI